MMVLFPEFAADKGGKQCLDALEPGSRMYNIESLEVFLVFSLEQRVNAAEPVESRPVGSRRFGGTEDEHIIVGDDRVQKINKVEQQCIEVDLLGRKILGHHHDHGTIKAIDAALINDVERLDLLEIGLMRQAQ